MVGLASCCWAGWEGVFRGLALGVAVLLVVAQVLPPTTQLHHSLGPFTLSFDSEADGKSLEGRSNYEQHAHQLLEFLHFDLEKKSQLHFWVTSLTSFHQRAQ